MAEVEALLRAGHVARAKAAGWLGDEAMHHLIQTGQGGAQRRVRLLKYSSELGCAFSSRQGVAIVQNIARGGTAAMAGLQVEDVVREVNGRLLFTCESVVEAVRAAGSVVELSVVRRGEPSSSALPAAPGCWSNERLVLAPGREHRIGITTEVPAVLQYEFETYGAHDVGFKVGAAEEESAGGDGESRPGMGRGMLLRRREKAHEGHVPLPNAGSYIVVIDNSYSYFRSKHVRYRVSLLSEDEFAVVSRRERRERLSREVAQRRERSRLLEQKVAELEPRLSVLRSKVATLESTLDASRAEKDENDARLAEAQAKLKATTATAREDA